MPIGATAFLIPMAGTGKPAARGRCLVARVGLDATPTQSDQPSGQAPSVPVDTCVLVDCGWFMQNEKLPADNNRGDTGSFCSKLDAAKSSIHPLIDALPPAYTLSLVAFGDSATCCATRMLAGQGSAWHKAVDSLAARAGSHLAVGLGEAGRLLLSGSQPSQKQILLIHGGQVRSAGSAIFAADDLAGKGVALDVIGLCADSSRQLAQRLVSPANGRTWLATTAAEAKAAVQSSFESTFGIVARDVVVTVDVSAGWGIRACVRCGGEHLVLYGTSTELTNQATIRLGGLHKDGTIDLIFYLEPLNADSPVGSLRCDIRVGESTRTESVSVSDAGAAGEGAGPIGHEDMQRAVRNCNLLEVKCSEALLYFAQQREDRDSVLRYLKQLHRQSQALRLSALERLITQLTQNYQHDSSLPTEGLNALVGMTSSLQTEVVVLPFRAISQPSAPKPSVKGEGAASPMLGKSGDDGTLDILLGLCQEGLATLERLSSAQPLGDDEVSPKTAPISPPVSEPLPIAYEDCLAGLAGETEKHVASVKSAASELAAAINEVRPVVVRLRHLRERSAAMASILRMAIECASFYGWSDAGWMASLDSLRLRGKMLRDIQEAK